MAAAQQGFAAEEGLELTLVRETSWANIRDRLIVGHFDAAHMLGPMTVASTLGIGHLDRADGRADLARARRQRDHRVQLAVVEHAARRRRARRRSRRLQGAALQRIVAARNRAQLAPLTFGMVYPFSCHNYELRYWLAAVGIDPDRDVRLVVIPPPLLADAMRAGQIDGFCVGEPWNSVAVEAGIGAIVTPTTAIWPSSPEKVLGCRASWAERHPERLAALRARDLSRARSGAKIATIIRPWRACSPTRATSAHPAQMLHRALVNRLPLMQRRGAAARCRISSRSRVTARRFRG